MPATSSTELERRFEQHGISRRRLYPLWYRLYRLLGLEIDPPVLLSLKQHYVYQGTLVALVALAGSLYNRCCMTTTLWALTPLFLLVLVGPLWNWWSYRRLRRRIGL